MKCPCKNCICVPMCRHKSYFDLLECPLLFPMYHNDSMSSMNLLDAPHMEQKRVLIKYLKPTLWNIDQKGWIGVPK